jgi:hypothetical protein
LRERAAGDGVSRRPIQVAVDANVAPRPDTSFLFIVGRGRSGTSMLRAMFDSHPEMAIPPESHIIVSLCRNRREYEDTNGLDLSRFVPAVRDLWTRRWALPERELLEVLLVARPTTVPDAIRTLFSAYASRQGKRRYGERTPETSFMSPSSLISSPRPVSFISFATAAM